MDVVLIIIIVIGVLWSLITGAIAISNSWRYCVAKGDASSFLSNVFGGIGGNWIAVFGIIILCLPVWLILSIVISSKKKQPYYQIQLRFTTDKRYDGVMNVYDEERNKTQSHEAATAKAVSYLVNKGVPRKEAEESMSYYSLIQTLSKL